jgi:putative addiction module CopG family antidote
LHTCTTMRSTQQFSITLPNEMAAFVRDKVRQGDYATESEVIRDGLRALAARDRAFQQLFKAEALKLPKRPPNTVEPGAPRRRRVQPA